MGRDRVAGQRSREPVERRQRARPERSRRAKYAGRPLGDVLRELQATGLNIVFSSEIVRPTMKVLTEPKAVRPRKILDEILRPHGLQVRSGPGGALLVVRLREQTSSPVTVAGQAQTPSPVTVAGQVVTGANKAPVVGAAVESDGRRAGERSRTRPVALRLTPLPDTLRLEVTAKGFVNQRVDLTVVAGMSAIEIVLDVSPEFRETVTVSALGPEEAPAAPQVVLAPAAVQRVAGAGDNVFHALQTLPGVNATEDWGSRLSVRGGGPDQNLTVMDGVEIHNPYRLFGITSAFNPEIVDRFELTAGGFGAKYGDRLSSILLVDNRQGTTTRRLAGSATSSFTDANVVLEGKLPGQASGSWLVTGRRTYYDLIAERIAKMDFPGFQDVQAKGVWDPKPGHRLTLFVLRSRESADIKEEDEDPDDGQLPTAIGKATRNDLAALSYSAPLGARASSRTVAAWYHNNDAVGVHGKGFDESQRSNSCCASSLRDDEDLVEAVFGTEVVDFTRDLNVRDVSLRQEFSVQAGQPPSVRDRIRRARAPHRVGVDGWRRHDGGPLEGDAVRGDGRSRPHESADRSGTATAPAFDQRHHTCRGLVPGSLPAARRCAPRTWPADRSQRPRGRDDRVSAARHARGPDAPDAAALARSGATRRAPATRSFCSRTTSST